MADDLMYSSAGDTQLNFQFTKTNVESALNKNLEHQSELSRSAGQEQLPDISEEDLVFSEDQNSVNFNLTATNNKTLKNGLAPFKQEPLNNSVKVQKNV